MCLPSGMISLWRFFTPKVCDRTKASEQKRSSSEKMAFIPLSSLVLEDIYLPRDLDQLDIWAKFLKHTGQMDQDLELGMKFWQCAKENFVDCLPVLLRHTAAFCIDWASNFLLKYLVSLWFGWEMTKSRWLDVWIPYGHLFVNYGDYSLN